MTTREVVFNCRDAVVSVLFKDNLSDNLVTCNGFFMKGYYIICPVAIAISDNISVYVTVSNLNGLIDLGATYVYEAKIIGLDIKANLCILKIDMSLSWNIKNPLIKSCHPFLLWGKSRNLINGEKIMMIHNDNQITMGNVTHNRDVDKNGTIHGELLSLSIHNQDIGCPVIDSMGKVVGIKINSDKSLSEFFMRKPIKALLDAYINKKSDKYGEFLFHNGSFNIYRHGWLNIKARLLKTEDYIQVKGECVKEIVGYIITDISSSSPLLNILQINDVIVAINKCPLGNRRGQISPSLVMWRISGECEVSYKKFTESYANIHVIKCGTVSEENTEYTM